MNIPKLVFKNLTSKKSRFVFTLSGITIGIASFVTLVSLGSGLKAEIKRQAGEIGGNLIVTPKGWCAYEQVSVLIGEKLPEAIPFDEFEKIASIKGLTAVPYLTERTAIKNNPVPVIGILPSEMKAFKKWEIGEGTYFESQNENAVIIGFSIAKQFELKPGDEITIRKQIFLIKGVLKETGTKDDIAIFMPLSIAQKIYGIDNKVSFIAVKVDDISKINEYILKIEDIANVSVVSDKELLKSVLSIVGTVSLTLQTIAAVAILAALFGIINTMMMAIYERKREIGILQAIGCTRGTIFIIFLFESLLYGFLGGVLGLVIGILLSYFGSPYISQNEFTAFLKGGEFRDAFNLSLIIGVLGFSVLISLASGLYPAYRASKITPVEAIAYE
ncbi:MAG: ABC transporter permease [candidate division WOR-3 bacterium]